MFEQITPQPVRTPDASGMAPSASTMPNAQYAKPGPYFTKLDTPMEFAFKQWVQNSKIPFDPSPSADYDMRGFFKAMITGDPQAKTAMSAFDGRPHFPDTYKTPYHKTFSNESMYALPTAPRWNGNKLQDQTGNIIADETPKKGQ